MQNGINSIFIVLIALSYCTSCSSEGKDNRTSDVTWNETFDFDGDQKIDTITYSFSGGAHCCYAISVWLSSTKTLIKFPFEIEGGYITFDLSQPENFFIKDFDLDGAPEIYMHIANYNGIDQPIPSEWTQVYGIRTNNVLIDFIDEKLKVSDYQLK